MDSHQPQIQTFDLTGNKLSGRYAVVSKLGEGGMASIYLSYDEVLKREVAIKTVPRTNLDNVELMRFQREARTASTMSHPNLIQMLDFGVSDNGQPFMVMELIKGVSMTDLIKRHGAQPVESSLEILEQIANGMAAVHKAGIVHRDLKTSNIMLTDVGMKKPLVRILDFGIAKSLSTKEAQVSTLTQAGQIFGSPNYMSPEQAKGEELDARADIYSLGCIAFELLTSKPMFEGETIMEVVSRHISEPPPLVSDALGPDANVPPQVENLVLKLVSKSREDRPGSMSEVADLIREVRSSIATSIDELSGSQEALPRKKLSKKKVVIFSTAASIALILLAVSAYFVNEFANGKVKPAVAKKKVPSEEIATDRSEFEFQAIGSEAPKMFQADNGAYLLVFGSDPGDKLREAIRKKQPVKYVVLQNSIITDDYMKLIVLLKPLGVNLGGSSGITDDTVKMLSTVPSIQSVDFDLCKSITPKAIGYLSKLPHLYMLSLRGCNLTDEHLKAMANMKFCRYFELSSNPRLTAKGLKYLSRKPDVVNVTADVGPLAFLPKTKRLEIYNSLRVNLHVVSFNSADAINHLKKFAPSDDTILPLFSPELGNQVKQAP